MTTTSNPRDGKPAQPGALHALFALAALLALAPRPAIAFDVQYIDAYRNVAFTQTADGPVLADAGAFLSTTVFTGGATVYSSGTVTPPGGGGPLPLVAQTPTRYGYGSAVLASKAALDAAFAPGSYAYTLLSASPPVNASYTLGADAYALSQPYLAGATYSALQGANAAAPINLAFSSFTVNPAASLSFIFFSVYDYTLGQFVFNADFLPVTSVGLALPAGTLQAGHSYAWELIFDSRVLGPAAGTDSGVQLGFDLRTSGQFATAVPELATWTLLAGGLCVVARRTGKKKLG